MIKEFLLNILPAKSHIHMIIIRTSYDRDSKWIQIHPGFTSGISSVNERLEP
jgi:hypothetical protein